MREERNRGRSYRREEKADRLCKMSSMLKVLNIILYDRLMTIEEGELRELSTRRGSTSTAGGICSEMSR